MSTIKEDLKQSITSLPREQRLALLLSYADDLSIDEIATIMRITADDAKALLGAALADIRARLGPVAVA